MADTYDVGYGKPPQHSRFRKGHSGNPSGRPKGSLDVKTELRRLLAIKTKIKLNGAVQTISTARALCLALIQKAMAGDVRAFSKIVELVGPEMADELKATASVSPADIDILHRALARREGRHSGPAASTADQPAEDN